MVRGCKQPVPIVQGLYVTVRCDMQFVLNAVLTTVIAYKVVFGMVQDSAVLP